MIILETLRDALQGLVPFVETKDKIIMAKALYKAGFDILDVGSFVSPRAVPQMKDTLEIIDQLDQDGPKIFVLVVNKRGGEVAVNLDKVSILGYSFSTSPEFLKRNINAEIDEAAETIYDLQNMCNKSGKELLLYFSMAFGNPYGDPDDPELIYKWFEKFSSWGIKYLSLSDITGVAREENVRKIYHDLSKEFPDVTTGLHLHVKNNIWQENVNAAYEEGCSVFDGVISGMGGCPMTGYELLGNLPTANLLEFAKKKNIPININENKFREAMFIVNKVMMKYL